MMEFTKFLPLFYAISQNLGEGGKKKAAVPFPQSIQKDKMCVQRVSPLSNI